MPREPGAFLSHPSFEVGDEWRDASAANGKARVGRQTIDLALDTEDRVDALDRLEGERRNDGELAARLGGYVGQREELAPAMRPAGHAAAGTPELERSINSTTQGRDGAQRPPPSTPLIPKLDACPQLDDGAAKRPFVQSRVRWPLTTCRNQPTASISLAVRYMPMPNMEWPITLFSRVTLGLGVRDPAIPIPMPGIITK
jgi:hypothetical protein